MALSMTGIGEGRITRSGFDVSILIRSLNHRYFQLQIRLPRHIQNKEAMLREKVATAISRGKIDLYVDFYSVPKEFNELVLQQGLAESLMEFAGSLAETFQIPNDMTSERLLKFPDILTNIPNPKSDSILEQILMDAIQIALDRLIEAKRLEGTHLVADLQTRIVNIQQKIDLLRSHSDKQGLVIRERLNDLVKKYQSGSAGDEQRMEQEILLLVVRSDFTEELTRLSSHLHRIAGLLVKSNPIGKESDFLVQELHREISTIGSKSAMKEISELVVDIKTEIEKIREQIQNIE